MFRLRHELATALLAGSVLAGAVACSGSGSQTIDACPGCNLTTYAATYRTALTNSFQSPPVTFTGTGQTATVQINQVQNGASAPYTGSVSGTFAAPCSAATVQNGAAGSGQVTVTSTASGDCTLLLTGAPFTIGVQVHVP